MYTIWLHILLINLSSGSQVGVKNLWEKINSLYHHTTYFIYFATGASRIMKDKDDIVLQHWNSLSNCNYIIL